VGNGQLELQVAVGQLWFGDNLEVLRRHVTDESVDLVYLDPPFNSNKAYNVLFQQRDGRKAAAQVKAFDDTWRWDMAAAATFQEVVEEGDDVSRALLAFRDLIGTTDMLAYLTMMAPRLVELHRVLRPTGSLYLHCDPTASHYLKLLLDAIFGPENFQNEIAWKRFSAKNDPKRFGRSHDVILFYSRSKTFTWNVQHGPFEDDYVAQNYRYVEEETGRRYRLSDLTAAKPGGDVDYEWHGQFPYKGRHWAYSRENMDQMLQDGRIVFRNTGMPVFKRYLDEQPGVALQDVWTDVRLHAGSKERLGYPTQKPIELLERILVASSNEGDVVLDPFCGCGTAVDAAQKLGRIWIGIDITKIAIEIIRTRLDDQYGPLVYHLGGEPVTVDDAEALAELDKHEFQHWVCRRLGVKEQKKKGADRGIDGLFVGMFENKESWKGILSVKGGGTSVAHVRDLRGTVERDKADFGVLVCLRGPTKAMRRDAADAGFTPDGVPRMQIVTIDDLLNGHGPVLPEPSARRSEGIPASRRSLRAV